MKTEQTLSARELDELEKRYDTSLNTRKTGVEKYLYWAMIAFAFYHLWTAGFGTPVDHVHMGIHLAGLFLFIFLSFPLIKTPHALEYHPVSFWRPGNIPLYDWVLAVLAMAAAMFLWLSWRGISGFGISIPEQMLRQGNPTSIDVFWHYSDRCGAGDRKTHHWFYPATDHSGFYGLCAVRAVHARGNSAASRCRLASVCQ